MNNTKADALITDALARCGSGETVWEFERLPLWTRIGTMSYSQIDNRADEIVAERGPELSSYPRLAAEGAEPCPA